MPRFFNTTGPCFPERHFVRTTVGRRDTATFIALFDRTEAGRKLSWDERLTWDELDTEGDQVTMVGL